MTGYFEQIGRYTLLLQHTFKRPLNARMFWKELLRQCVYAGIDTVWIIALLASFIGMVITLQMSYLVPPGLVPKPLMAMIARDFCLLELLPAGLAAVLSGIIGYRMAYELGYMQINEQVAALEVMGINSRNYLVLPRLLACMYTMPCLIIVAITCCIGAGLALAAWTGFMSVQEYIQGITMNFKPYNLSVCMVKTTVFSFIIPTVSTCCGYHARHDAQQVSMAAVRAVMYNCVLVIGFDYLISDIML
ncbi:MlaE family ABC transporter permease [Deminuibacter soli]|uniref:ABC transporter permease n=1 Tax=Deminuibacter soli TaxID=2291815 RepID=A0A3E1NKU7_9BACT|nr:ABC transporter permease [Deminuibacter soli]RFM28560.1 ABC transporter permease [Deminuibacter soli]